MLVSSKFIRKIYYYKHYYLDFFHKQSREVKAKFNWTLALVASLDRIPVKYFKHIEGADGLYEIRVEVGKNIFRVFCFFDEGQLIILINGFQKKSDKTPMDEIELAMKLKKQYFDEKESE